MNIISHNSFNNYDKARQEILNKISNDTLLINELDKCKLEQFIIINRGLNAWTKIITSRYISVANTNFEKKLILNMPTFMGKTNTSYLNASLCDFFFTYVSFVYRRHLFYLLRYLSEKNVPLYSKNHTVKRLCST